METCSHILWYSTVSCVDDTVTVVRLVQFRLNSNAKIVETGGTLLTIVYLYHKTMSQLKGYSDYIKMESGLLNVDSLAVMAGER